MDFALMGRGLPERVGIYAAKFVLPKKADCLNSSTWVEWDASLVSVIPPLYTLG